MVYANFCEFFTLQCFYVKGAPDGLTALQLLCCFSISSNKRSSLGRKKSSFRPVTCASNFNQEVFSQR